MNRLIRCLPLLPLLSCGNEASEYDVGLLDLAAGFSAKEVCSCVFVMERDEATCREWTRVSPDVARFEVDREKKEVRASAVLLGGAVARYTGPRTGCILAQE